MPPLVLSEAEKTPEWCEQVLDSIISYMSYDDGFYLSGRTKDIRNYLIYNGQVNQQDYSYITEQYGLTYPARLVNYPIITPKIDLLVGEEIRRPLDMKVTTINKDAIIRKLDHKVAITMRALLQDIHDEFEQQQGVSIIEQGTGMPVPLHPQHLYPQLEQIMFLKIA